MSKWYILFKLQKNSRLNKSIVSVVKYISIGNLYV